jgi:hypothetical protein
MTFQPPPPPPEGEPPPPPPGYGQQPVPGGPRSSFDPKTINPLDWGLLAAGVLAFIFSFVSYYTASIDYQGIHASGHINAWHGFFGWFAMLCALVGSGIVALALFAPQVRLSAPPRLIALIAYAIAALCVIIAIFVVPIDMTGAPPGASKGHGFGFWISLIVILAGLVLALMRFQQTGGQLPGALSKIPDIGSRAPGGSGSNTPPPPPPAPGPPGP